MAKLPATHIVNLMLVLHGIFSKTLPFDPPGELSNDDVLEVVEHCRTVLKDKTLDSVTEFATHPEQDIESELRKRLGGSGDVILSSRAGKIRWCNFRKVTVQFFIYQQHNGYYRPTGNLELTKDIGLEWPPFTRNMVQVLYLYMKTKYKNAIDYFPRWTNGTQCATEPRPSVGLEQHDEAPSPNLQSRSHEMFRHSRRQRDIHKICPLPLVHLGRR